ncbi:MAG: peptidoglycan-binding protein [Candidatus Liptonbacteria bacterium]|nr:peptidoglycan-binding protein [Candidatus Liptonbacteria bacterium]
MVPIFITFTDIAGNNGRASVNISSGSARPTIASITSNATSPGVLKVGDSIAFTLTPNIVEPLASVSGYYNGVSLTWSTYNGGATYVATYTAANGNADQTYPLQINNVTLTNQFGSASLPASGYDVQKTIDAHPPIVGEVTLIASPATTPTPSYIFSSSDNGTIRYSGDCLSQTTYASAGINTIIFNALSTGLHNNCAISVADNAGNVSNQLNVSPFTVQGATEALTAQIQALQNQLTQLQSQQSTVGSYKFLNPLKFGSTGTDVTELQKRLIAEGVYSGPVTGYYGALTQAAVKRYQAKHGLPQLGIVGPATRTLLNK